MIIDGFKDMFRGSAKALTTRSGQDGKGALCRRIQNQYSEHYKCRHSRVIGHRHYPPSVGRPVFQMDHRIKQFCDTSGNYT